MTLHILSRTSTKPTPLNLFDTPHDCFKVFSPRYPILFHYIYSRSIISDFSVFLRLWIKFLQIFNFFFPANNILLFFLSRFSQGYTSQLENSDCTIRLQILHPWLSLRSICRGEKKKNNNAKFKSTHTFILQFLLFNSC